MRKINYPFLIILFAVLLGLGIFLENEYYISIVIYILINALNATGFNLLLGYTGIISLGQAAFFGIGAYASGILCATYGWDPLSAAAMGVLASVFVAYIIGFPSLKLYGHYLAMATLGFGMIINIVLNEMDFITGGPSGLVDIPDLSFFGKFPLSTESSFYIFIAIFFMLSFILYELFDKSFLSYKTKFIKESESASSSFGINVASTKLKVFVVVAAITSLNGSIFAHYSHFISPVSFSFKYSIELLTMGIVGGLGYISGGILGATLLTLLPEFIAEIEDYEMVIYGVILAVSIMFFPNGIAGIIKNFFIKFKRTETDA
jgi:branched-chain amino acid transport system permease protein